ncbi:hypothetical protein Tco_0318273 [Tanacetum coccineum]
MSNGITYEEEPSQYHELGEDFVDLLQPCLLGDDEPSQYHELGEDFVDLLQPYLLGDDGKKKTIHRVSSFQLL